MLKELFEDLWQKAKSSVPVELTDIHGIPHANKSVHAVLPPEVPKLSLTSLSGLIDFIKANKDGINLSDVILTVDSYQTATLRGKVAPPFQRREIFAVACALQIDAFEFGTYDDLESFTIEVQTKFVDDAERRRLLALAASITSGPIRTVVDDGVTQEVTLKAGITMQAKQEVRNPFNLRPFRTFSEIDQPVSPFIFRLQQGRAEQPPTAALFEADGGAWRIAAMSTINRRLRAALPDLAGQVLG